MRMFVIGLILLVAGLLVGFVPEYLKASHLQQQVNSCNGSLQVAQIRQSAALLYLSASELNYGIASQRAADFFSQAQMLANTTTDSNLRTQLQQILTSRDKITTALAKGDSQVLGELQSVVSSVEQGPPAAP